MKKCVSQALPLKMDMTEKFPFQDDTFDAVVADLSLHYFEWALTKQIVGEIERVLKKYGLILARFNSDKDHGYGTDNGKIIEPGLRLVDGRTKRFFRRKILMIFSKLGKFFIYRKILQSAMQGQKCTGNLRHIIKRENKLKKGMMYITRK